MFGDVRMPRTKLLSAISLDDGADPGYQIDELVPERDFCQEHKVTDRTAREWRENGGGPEYTRIGRSIFYRRSRIRAWHDARTFRRSDEESARQQVTEHAA